MPLKRLYSTDSVRINCSRLDVGRQGGRENKMAALQNTNGLCLRGFFKGLIERGESGIAALRYFKIGRMEELHAAIHSGGHGFSRAYLEFNRRQLARAAGDF